MWSLCSFSMAVSSAPWRAAHMHICLSTRHCSQYLLACSHEQNSYHLYLIFNINHINISAIPKLNIIFAYIAKKKRKKRSIVFHQGCITMAAYKSNYAKKRGLWKIRQCCIQIKEDICVVPATISTDENVSLFSHLMCKWISPNALVNFNMIISRCFLAWQHTITKTIKCYPDLSRVVEQ